ncbi:MAG: lysophospholipid acyltransferase family protein [Syntrophaceae bacterium]|jgi:KDO2-lipid IV(A) lauroyltransferase|nr:lysophospholipid acyltransferase family protein [Syntrophaceae bacterium]
MKEKEEKRAPSLWLELFLFGVNSIPLSWRIFFFEGLGRLLYLLDDRHRRIARRNLALAFPHKDNGEKEEIVQKAFRHLARVAAEFSYTPRLNERNIKGHVYFEGMENFYQAQKKGRGVIFLTAHFGNWEWMAAAFPLYSQSPCHVVFRPLDSPFLDKMVDRLRTSTGNGTIPKQRAMGHILRLLKEGKTVGILLDQNMAWQEGVFVDFFGVPACTNTGVALLALKTGAAVLPVFNIREKDGRYRAVIEPEVPLVRTGDKKSDVHQNTQLFTRIIEGYIRNYPDHWLWVHQRWKTRPWQAAQLRGA